jgi:Protein of unknown function (DUF4236)
MGFRFREHIRLFPGLTLNVSKSGVSTSLGAPRRYGYLNSKDVQETVGLAGSGLSYRRGAGQ